MNKLFIGLAAGIALGVAGGIFGANMFGGAAPSGGATEKKILYWVAPMDANFRRDEPGKSPMGMDLIPVYEGQDSGGDEDGIVKISAAVVNNIGVRTKAVVKQDLSRQINTVGYVGFDETTLSHIHVRAQGWIEKLHVKTVGERVRAGQVLFEYYSPDLVNAQAEYLQAVQTGRTGLINASLDRLRSLEMTAKDIEIIRKTGKLMRLVPIVAPQNGIVSDLMVRQGMYIKPNMTIMTLGDLDSIWVLVDVFEDQAQWVDVGQVALMSLPYITDQNWEGIVDYVYPALDATTRTLKVRLRFDNPKETLKPNMYADIRIAAEGRKGVLAVPREAVIRSGDGNRLVLDQGDGRFKVIWAKTGMESQGLVEIREGISEGDRVVVSAQFLIDSEANLSASQHRMAEAGARDEAPMSMHAAVEPEAWGEGTVNAVMASDGKLNITHAPIPALGWPDMTMDFATIGNVSIDGLAEGDKVRFGLNKDAEGMFAISVIEMPSMTMSAQEPMAWGEGVVNAVIASDTVNVTHGPIPTLGWPDMTMDFKALPGTHFEGLKPGDKVRFGLNKDAEGMFAISIIEALKEKEAAQ